MKKIQQQHQQQHLNRHNHKFKPLTELYNHVDSFPLFNVKVDSEFENKCLKNSTSEKCEKAEYCESNTCALPCEPLLRVSSEMEKKAIDSSEVTVEHATVGQAPLDEVCLDRSVSNQRQLASGEIASLGPGSCQSTCPEDTSLNSAKTSDVIEDVNMLQDVNTSQPSVELKGQDVLDCHDDKSFCISKDNVVVMATIDQTGDVDPTNVTPNAASVESVCLVTERSLNGHSTPTGSFSDQLSVEGGDKCSSRPLKTSSESLMTTTDSSDRSDTTETSVHRDEQDGALTEKCVTYGCRKEQVDSSVTNMITSNISQQNENHEMLKPKTGFSDTNPPAADFSRSDGSESLKSNPPVANTQEPLIQSQIKINGDGSDELVDVRVCDICGDGGREALLALCTTCSDGAEHIYCMRIKMDKVPERDWMCEDCIGMQEPKGHSQTVAGKAGSALTPSCLKESTRSLPRVIPGVQQAGKTSSKNLSKALSFPGPAVQKAGKMSSKHLSKCLSFPGKRPGPRIEVRSTLKKKTFQAGVHSPGSPCDGTKAQVTRISSLNHIHKGKSTSPQVSSIGGPAKRAFDQAFSSGHRSPKLEKRFCKGSLYQSEKDGMSELDIKVQQSKDDVLLRSVPAKESADIKMDKVPNKKLIKSLSIAGSVLPDVSNAPSSYISKSKSPRAVNGRDLTKKVYVSEKNTNRLGPSSTSSCSMKVRSSRMKLVPETATAVPFLDKTASGNTKVRKTDFLQEGKRRANILAGSVGEKMPSDPGYKGSQPTWKGGLNGTAKDKKRHFVAPGNVLQHELRPKKPRPLLAPAKVVLSGSSAIPAAESVWKGGFQLERSGKVPNYCSGIQAHLSSCASSEVHEVVLKFGPKLLLKESPRSETWPTYFRTHHPTEQDIALYFFAEDLQSYDRSFKMLLDSMIEKDLVLEASFNGVELLVLPSSLLPVTSQRWNSIFFLWGVCKGRKVGHHSLHTPNLGVKSLNKKKRTCLTNGSVDKCAVLEAGSLPGSQTSHSILEPEAVDSLLLLSSAVIKSSDQSCNHHASSIECLGSPEENDMHPDKIQIVHDPKEEALPSRVFPTGDMLKRIQSDDRDITHISKTATFPSGQANGQNMLSSAENVRESGLHSDRSSGGLSVPWLYNSASEFCSKQDVASRSSFSLDSGPSASSDGCAKSDEVHGEQVQRSSNSRGLNLDLCLGFSSDPDERVDLNLVLGFPSEYQPKHCTENTITRDMNISPVLSLGMPCSNV